MEMNLMVWAVHRIVKIVSYEAGSTIRICCRYNTTCTRLGQCCGTNSKVETRAAFEGTVVAETWSYRNS